MKPVLLLAVFFSPVLLAPAFAQEVAQEGTIQLKIENTAGDNPPPIPQGAEGASFVRMGEGEIKAKLLFKNGMTKMETDMGFGANQVIYDSKTKTTTTLFEIMGQKRGFYTNEEEIKKMMAADTSRRRQQQQPFTPEIFIEYLADTKKIAGMECKKAIIRYTTRRGEDMAQEVWYSPEFKMDESIQMGEVLRMASVPGLQKLKGFPMEFLIKRPNGSTSYYQVTKVDLKTKVDDKAFVIPKGYEVKPMSEMGNMGGGRGNTMFRMGQPN